MIWYLKPFLGKTVQVQMKHGHTWSVCVATPNGPQPFTMQVKTPDGQMAEAPVGMPFLIGEVVGVGEYQDSEGTSRHSFYGIKMDDQASRSPNNPGGSGKKLVVVVRDEDIENVTFVAEDRIVVLGIG